LSESGHILVVANETVVSPTLIAAIQEKATEGTIVTVVAPISDPSAGYVVYADTRRAAARRRLDRTMARLREAGVLAHGLVVDSDPADAVRDAIEQAEPPVTSVLVSTHPLKKSGWLRRNVVDQVRRAAGKVPVEHLVVPDVREEGGKANVLVLANETVVGEPLLAKIRARAAASPASFLIVSPQSDPTVSRHPEAEKRLRRAIAELRGAGIETHGQIAHPDPFAAALQAIEEERVDEIIVSTYPGARSGWLRRDLVSRLRNETQLPVEHVTVAEQEVASV
jgi:predicted deacetylase